MSGNISRNSWEKLTYMDESTELVLHNFAYGCYQQGQWQKAIDTFRQLVMYLPNKSEYWYGLGSSLMMTGNDKDAAHAFEIACITRPEDPRPYAYWAEALSRLGSHDLAEIVIKEAEKKAKTEKFAAFLGQVDVIKERIVEVSHG